MGYKVLSMVLCVIVYLLSTGINLSFLLKTDILRRDFDSKEDKVLMIVSLLPFFNTLLAFVGIASSIIISICDRDNEC